MGKRLRLNRFITKWIKSDLPQDCSSVLLLGVTRIPTSPVPARRPSSLPLKPSHLPDSPHLRRNSVIKRRSLVRKKSSVKNRDQDVPLRQPLTARVVDNDTSCSSGSATPTPDSTAASPPELNNSDERSPEAVMEKSVDSIGSCSIDMEASVETAGWSEKSSTGTLLSASILSSTPEPHLPSYLSLACTVNGYSTITNYDPVRLTKSRDASPQRPDTRNLTQPYTVLNNLLSPPNLVPLPNRSKVTTCKMTDQEFYSTNTTIESYCSKETRYTSKFMSNDSVDACYENNRNSINEKYISSFDKKVIQGVLQKQTYESNLTTESTKTHTEETKSFIQQRVERLYGPGALAQGFFVKKRQKNGLSESDAERKLQNSDNHHSVSMSDKLLRDTTDDASCMKQSTSSPVLPVLRHLRPEFRAQLPIINKRKISEPGMQKSCTVPTLKDEIKSNGHSKENGKAAEVEVIEILDDSVDEHAEVKDGHYFLKVLDKEATRLLKKAEECEAELEKNPDLSEDAIGYIRSASGKARLLVSQKMQQFKGLCTNNITQIEGEAFPTTNEDLQGFWDMVMLQVKQVDALFEDISKLKQNDWKLIEPVQPPRALINGTKPKKTITRPTKSKANCEEAQRQRTEREAERKRLIEERRKAMKAKCNKQEQNIEIFVAESS